VRIGFLPAIVSTFLIRQIGEKQARDLLLTGRIITAETARDMGLVNEVVQHDSLMTRARSLANELLENSPSSLAATKQLLSGYAFDEINASIKAAVDANARIRATHDFREGVTSFLEKRKPKWTGK
jgi:methylglutaconyl-CoA hydratase